MPSNKKLYPLTFEPGIQKDGTEFSTKKWVNGKWVRFYRGFVQKRLGFRQITNPVGAVPSVNVVYTPRGVGIFNQNDDYWLYYGNRDGIRFLYMDKNGFPRAGYNLNLAYLSVPLQYNWLFDSYLNIDQNGLTYYILAHSAVLQPLDSTPNFPLLFNQLGFASPQVFTPVNTYTFSGGFSIFGRVIFAFGNDGEVAWNNGESLVSLGNPSLKGGRTAITSRKIVAARPTRGGGLSPAGLFWSLDSVIRATFNGTDSNGALVFKFDTLSAAVSVLSSNAIVEYDGIFYWPAVDRFLLYDGVVRDLPNDTNKRWFFQSLNFNQREKIWGVAVPEFGEIHWFFPQFNSEECNKVIIYNLNENTWYDDDLSRSCGIYSQVLNRPVFGGSDIIPGVGIEEPSFFIHEEGLNRVAFNASNPNAPGESTGIAAFIESSYISFTAFGPDGTYNGIDRWLEISRFEPDFIFNESTTESLRLTLVGKKYAQSSQEQVKNFNINANTEFISMQWQARLTKFVLSFDIGDLNSYFEIGQPLMLIDYGDANQ